MYNAEIHYLQDGATEVVNGQTVTGPCYVVDSWELRGQAICPYGVDSQTSTQFSAGKLPASIPLIVREAAMSADATKDSSKPDAAVTNPAAGAAPGTTQTASKDATTPTTQVTTPATPQSDASRADLKKYMDRFGAADGAQYYADGLTWEQSLEQALKKSQTRRKRPRMHGPMPRNNSIRSDVLASRSRKMHRQPIPSRKRSTSRSVPA